MQARSAFGGRVQHDQADALRQICGTLGQEGLASRRAILVARADQLNRRNQLQPILTQKDPDFKIIGEYGLNSQLWLRRSPGRRRESCSRWAVGARRSQRLPVERGDVDLDLISKPL